MVRELNAYLNDWLIERVTAFVNREITGFISIGGRMLTRSNGWDQFTG
jgi:hypothetical protein